MCSLRVINVIHTALKAISQKVKEFNIDICVSQKLKSLLILLILSSDSYRIFRIRTIHALCTKKSAIIFSVTYGEIRRTSDHMLKLSSSACLLLYFSFIECD